MTSLEDRSRRRKPALEFQGFAPTQVGGYRGRGEAPGDVCFAKRTHLEDGLGARQFTLLRRTADVLAPTDAKCQRIPEASGSLRGHFASGGAIGPSTGAAPETGFLMRDIKKTKSVKKFTKSLAAPPGVCISSARAKRVRSPLAWFFGGGGAGEWQRGRLLSGAQTGGLRSAAGCRIQNRKRLTTGAISQESRLPVECVHRTFSF